ncbi:MAG: IscS subfamily cysteine desulfurase [Peptococcaceae bacterium]|jgi:cysteine desulfurase|nr:IscS subfamily cysteine desulfurase [Peptococcaceae bacterium]
MRRIYFDHSATTPVHPAVAEEMGRFLSGDNFGNPSSAHYYGFLARRALAEAREKVARAIGAAPAEIVFTSGGTESANLAVHGAARANSRRGNHVLTSAVEHHAVLDSVQALKREGFAVAMLPVDRFGLVDAAAAAAVLTEKTILISIMQANNEVGTLMPVAEIGKLARERGILFHVDAVQALGKIPVQVDDLGVDLLSLSAHKIYGPKGVGALYIRKGTPWKQSLCHGGSQEKSRRAGTENVPGIIGFARAVELAMAGLVEESRRLSLLRDKLIGAVLNADLGATLTGHPRERLPNHASFCFKGIESRLLLRELDRRGIAASSGSACTAGSQEPSHVLVAMGIPPIEAYGALRLTMGRSNTEEDIDFFLSVLRPVVERLRSLPFQDV